jgi:hypothetical protein
MGTSYESALNAPVEDLGLTRRHVGADVIYTIEEKPQPRWR